VRDFDLEIADGEFMILVGPSGCGKTTLLRMIAGLEQITAGEVMIGDRIVNDLTPKDRDIAMVFQNYALYPHMTVAKNMGFALKRAKTPAAEIRRKVEDAARMLSITEQLDRKPSNLSGGQRQRVAMGRAIVRDPQAFLMDEPLSNLDAKLRIQMRAEILRIQRQLGTTTVYVTHDQTEAMTMADRVVLLRGGRVEQVGSPEDLYARPQTAFTASFIGAPPMNLMALNGAQTLTGVRPEDMRLARDGLEAQVEAVEYLGADSLVAARARQQTLLVRVAGRAPVRAGDAVRIAWDKEHEHRFDAQTGGRKP
jgi:sn-glycerol 3-phosphate transport system ATP-binding protein